jgi:hypothetical protein
METRLTLRPGMPGTKKLVARFGERLVCVRYLYDPQARRRLKTVELVVEVVEWQPRERRPRTIWSECASPTTSASSVTPSRPPAVSGGPGNAYGRGGGRRCAFSAWKVASRTRRVDSEPSTGILRGIGADVSLCP